MTTFRRVTFVVAAVVAVSLFANSRASAGGYAHNGYYPNYRTHTKTVTTVYKTVYVPQTRYAPKYTPSCSQSYRSSYRPPAPSYHAPVKSYQRSHWRY